MKDAPMLIRAVQDADFPAMASLMRALSLEFVVHDCDSDTATAFVETNDEHGLRGFAAAGIVYHVAMLEGRLAGFVAVREYKHLYHLFVARDLHGRGIARALWEVARQAAIDAGGDGVFTVNASNHAVGAYEAMGFVRTGPNQKVKGLFVNPMRLTPSVPGLVGAP